MRLPRGKRNPLSAFLLAAFLLAAELAVYAHLLDHELTRNDAQCAVCLHAAQLERPATATGVALTAPAVVAHAASLATPLPPACAPVAASTARGPPHAFESLFA